jgi:4-hydroxymandelate oxidase
VDSAEFDELEDRAREILSPGAFAFAAGGADDEVTLADNVAAWQRLRLRPRVLRDITAIDTSVTLLGEKLPMPILVAPSGRHRLFHREGEAATARGAAAAGVPYVTSTSATVSIEDVARERGGASQWLQLYMYPDRAITEQLIDRAVAAGFRGIVFTVDQPVYGSSPRANAHPITADPKIRHMNLPGQPIARTAYDPAFKGAVMFPTTFRDLEWLVKRAPIDIVVKGVLRGDDAQRCVDAGAKAIVVSNHGGRHLDTVVATADALSEVVAAIGGKADVLVDGGIRRGTDIVKALALGASAVLIGRPVLWGLATGGAEGVREVFEHFRGELWRAMALVGAARVDELTSDLLARPNQ